MSAKYSQASTRVMRQATAYARLAAKAYRAGHQVEFDRYQARYFQLSDRALRMRDREAEVAARRAEGQRRWKQI